MNSVQLSFGENSAILCFGVEDGKRTLTLTATGECNKLVLGALGTRQKEARCDDSTPLTATYASKGFVAYWVVENHADMEVIRVLCDTKQNAVALSLLVPNKDEEPVTEDDWKMVSFTDLSVLPTPEYKFYNYRAEVSAKTLNAPKRPRGRPRKPAAAKDSSA
jgi:hypothetical protein